MALSLGSGRRRWLCRAARRGGKGAAGCRHFHVHYHFPRQVRAFPSLRLPPLFSLLPYLLIPPVLFFVVVAFLVCFGWFTLVYFVSSLLRKCDSHECLERDSDANELRRNEEQARNEEERTTDCVAGGTGCSAIAEACIDGKEIKEVFVVDVFSDASLDMSRMASPYNCTKDEEHFSCEKIVEEVMVFERNCKECNEVSYLDVSLEKEQLQETPVDWFVEEIDSRANLVPLQSGQEFNVNRKEDPTYSSSETVELIDKYETRAVIVICSDNSAENNVKCGADLSDAIFVNKLPEDIIDGYQDAQNMVTDRTNKQREFLFIEDKGKKILRISDETHDLNNESEMSGLPVDFVSANKYSTVATSSASLLQTSSAKEDGHQKELTKDNREEASRTTSLFSNFAENNQVIREEVGVPSPEDNIHEVASGECSVIGKTEDVDENSGTSEISTAGQGTGGVY
ncbi:hypothetical protein PR202_gb24497 [Eleusine coracana subsp. coracana]|uniref:Uncharacterized protein n=1 Tax=Eleusine coracana subsp. coracana TaxID=191504 RepID=A0AAV5FM66_ELECO|nr:hypothetical protein PR202_gb24497 [Eleusine coracana subsp. coracana]